MRKKSFKTFFLCFFLFILLNTFEKPLVFDGNQTEEIIQPATDFSSDITQF